MCGSFHSSGANKSWSKPQPVLPHLYLYSSFHSYHWSFIFLADGWASEIHEQAWKSLLGGKTKNKERRENTCIFLSSLHMSPSSWVAVFTRACIFCLLYYMLLYVFVHQSDTFIFSKYFLFVFIQILSWDSSKEGIKSSWNGSSGGHT